MKGAAQIFRFLIDAAVRGEKTALITVTDVIGSSSRSAGTHMAVSETGLYLGSLSGGCFEAAVVGEAQRVIETGHAELIRFGEGSRYIDIRLPCGGAIEFLVSPQPSLQAIREALECLERRIPVALQAARDGAVTADRSCTRGSGWHRDLFVAVHQPDLRVIVIGHGAEAQAMMMLALAYGAVVELVTPDENLVRDAGLCGVRGHLLRTASGSPDLQSDPFTAIVLLFHDHDWEIASLTWALHGDAFFIGAMGSRMTHQRRLMQLRDHGVCERDLRRITGPIGLIPATRDPDTLALSALSQLVKIYEEQLARIDSSANWSEKRWSKLAPAS